MKIIDKPLKGKVTLRINSIDYYDDLWFKRPPNDPSSNDYVPLALQIKGKIEESEGIVLNKSTAYFLIPEPDFKELNIPLKKGDRICLWITERGKCFKFEKC